MVEAEARALERLRAARQAMVREQLAARGIRDERVLAAMGRVPREAFLEPAQRAQAYEDHPLPIGHGQTISQPYMVAHVAQLLALRGDERVLDVGAGSGYQTAVLCELVPAGRVYAVERIPELAALAERHLGALGYPVPVLCGDGSQGWPEHAPYDAIAVAAGAPEVPPLLLDQLADGGRLVLPVGGHREQQLLLLRRVGDRIERTEDIHCVYVDLIGRGGWRAIPPGG